MFTHFDEIHNVTDGRPLHHDTGHAIYAQCQAAKILTKF